MNFVEYTKHIANKYRLAVAIAVIKNKPENISIQDYVEQLKENIRTDMDSDDDTICSEDFEIPDDVPTNGAAENDGVSANEQISVDVDDVIIQLNNNSESILKDIDFFKEQQMSNINKGEIERSINNKTNILDTQTTFCETQYQLDDDNYFPDDGLTFCGDPTPNNNPKEVEIQHCRNKQIVKLNATHEYVVHKDSQINKINDKAYDSQETEIYTLRQYSQFNTHISETQNTQFLVEEKYIFNKNKDESCKRNGNTDYYADSKLNDGSNHNYNINERNHNNDIHFEEIDYNTQYLSNNINNVGHRNSQNEIINEGLIPKAINNELPIRESEKRRDTFEREDTPDNSPSKEIIPFKVIEELNKIKFLLNKRGGKIFSNENYSTDSGYKSDSLGISFKNALQSPGSWLNESAHTLFSYVTSCPILSTTQDITSEISQVIAQLIDRLHEEENYPLFLDKILEHINLLITEIYETDNFKLLDKEEYIHRFFLLNKSLHIIRYSIEQITNILQSVLDVISKKDDVYEITNTIKSENLSYIFYMLEKLIKRYILNKNLSSQTSTQPSQDEDRILKRSSITDIWKKKWNPNYKEKEMSSTNTDQCVLTKCGDILNKIIVQSIDGYSLIAFSALHCFNLLQN